MKKGKTVLDQFLEKFLDKGILGLITAINILVIMHLYKRVEALRDQIQAILQKHIEEVKELQEEKLEMQEAHLQTLLKVKDEVTAVVQEVTATIRTLLAAMTKG